jgi:hypothetical protein
MAKAKHVSEPVGEFQEELGDRRNGHEESNVPATAPEVVFDAAMFEAMQDDDDVSPAREIAEKELEFCPIRKPGKSYITMHPSPKYELIWPVTFNFDKSNYQADPYLILKPFWRYFPPDLISIKRIVLCLRWEDELLKPFLWVAPWCEESETPTDIHKSVERCINRGRQGWGQALWRQQQYTWVRWPESRGEAPLTLWPDRTMFQLVEETFEGRIIAALDHPLIQALGEVRS